LDEDGWVRWSRLAGFLGVQPRRPFSWQTTLGSQDIKEINEKAYLNDIRHDKGMKTLVLYTNNVELTIGLTVENHPNGLPRLASFLASDENFGIFRSFKLETTRLLAVKQIEIHLLTKELQKLDISDGQNPAMKYRLHSVEHYATWDSALVELLQMYEDKITAYCKV